MKNVYNPKLNFSLPGIFFISQPVNKHHYIKLIVYKCEI